MAVLAEVSKLNAYAVLSNDAAEVSKLNAYAVLSNDTAQVSKLNAYAVLVTVPTVALSGQLSSRAGASAGPTLSTGARLMARASMSGAVSGPANISGMLFSRSSAKAPIVGSLPMAGHFFSRFASPARFGGSHPLSAAMFSRSAMRGYFAGPPGVLAARAAFGLRMSGYLSAFPAPINPLFTFPVLRGQGYPRHKKPNFDTIVAKHPSGRDVRDALWDYPLWDFEVLFNGLDSGPTNRGMGAQSFDTLFNFFMSLGGQWATFLYVDPDDYAVTQGTVGTGDGSTTLFRLRHSIGSFTEPVGWVTSISAVYFNGTIQSAGSYSIQTPNQVSFVTAPTSGVVITASYQYAFVCRLTEDNVDFEQFMGALWQVKSLKFRSVRVQ